MVSSYDKKMIFVSMVAIGVGIFSFQNCSQTGFSVDSSELASVESTITNPTRRSLSANLFSAGIVDLEESLSQGTGNSCADYLQNNAITTQPSFNISIFSMVEAPGGVAHPRFVAIKTEKPSELKALKNVKYELVAWNRFGQKQDSLNIVDSSGSSNASGFFHLNWQHAQSSGREKSKMQYQVVAKCDGIQIAQSNKLEYQHIPECWTGISTYAASNLPPTSLSVNDQSLGLSPRIDMEASSSVAATLFSSMGSVEVSFRNVDFTCQGAHGGDLKNYSFTARKLTNGFVFDSRSLGSDPLVNYLRRCSENILASGNMVALYRDAQSRPVCVSEYFRKKYSIPVPSTSIGSISGGSTSGSTSSGSSGSTNSGSTGTATTQMCDFPGAKDPDSVCSFPSHRASAGQQVEILAQSPNQGSVQAYCQNDGTWSRQIVSCKVSNQTGAECVFPGGSDPSGRCVYPSFSAQSGFRKAGYSTSGPIGRVVATCENGEWKDIQWNCQ